MFLTLTFMTHPAFNLPALKRRNHMSDKEDMYNGAYQKHSPVYNSLISSVAAYSGDERAMEIDDVANDLKAKCKDGQFGCFGFGSSSSTQTHVDPFRITRHSDTD